MSEREPAVVAIPACRIASLTVNVQPVSGPGVLAALDARLERPRPLARGLGVDQAERVDDRVDRGDARERRLDGRERRDRPPATLSPARPGCPGRCRRDRRASAPRPCSRRRSRRREDQRRRLAERGARLRALAVEPAPEAHERVRLPLARDRRVPDVAGIDHAGWIELEQAVHDRAAQVLEARRRGAAHAADRAREERVAREALGCR